MACVVYLIFWICRKRLGRFGLGHAGFVMLDWVN
jgi:hypothetical protein